MNVTSAIFTVSSSSLGQCPSDGLPEFAFIGRSNVGKSSLINMLTDSPSLAKVSSTPGKTWLVNHFLVNGSWYLVDLPGYGYANANIEIKAKWGQMIENYLHTSEQLRMVFLLIDLRHKPTNNDVQMYRWILSNGFSPVIVATKADKIKRSQLQKQLKLLKDTLKVIEGVPIVPFSAVTKAGRDEIWELIEEYALAEE